ncbi:MAG: FliI/YscN family ATPase [Oligoflexales bacterium]|nr:FliI/YscN family ATPase [Oligoflexales bacterium]
MVHLSSLQMKRFSNKDLSLAFKSLPLLPEGQVCEVIGQIIEASLPRCQLSTILEIEVLGQEKPVLAQVVGFRSDRALLFPFSEIHGITPGARVSSPKMHDRIPVGPFLLGKVIDPFLQELTLGPLNALAVPKNALLMPVENEAPNPMSRAMISTTLPLGIKAIDGLLTFCEGQRMGIMAGSGVGKSVLLGMIAKGSAADINVIALIGERGREVREFLEKELGAEGLKKSVVVVVTSDQSPLLRLRGAKVATAIAEYFSMCGKKVLLMMDSLTRVAQAQREIGLAVGEPPTSKGYPPSVFSLLPKLLERCGPQESGKGSISGLYTVLVDGDDFNDPIPDCARAILDGHLNLSRSLAAKGHFPAIEVPTSTSRVMSNVVNPKHLELASHIKALIGVYQENIDYILMGSYQKGTHPLLDEAILKMAKIEKFLKQTMKEQSSFDNTINDLVRIYTDRGDAN